MENVFLSYSHQNQDLMNQLRNDLGAHGFPVWTDENMMRGTPFWQQKIEQEIKNARCMVVLLSPDAKQSENVNKEIVCAKTNGLTIIPFLMKGAFADAIPFELLNADYIDATANLYSEGLQKLVRTLMHVYLGLHPDDIFGFRGKVSLQDQVKRAHQEILVSGIALDTIALNWKTFAEKIREKADSDFRLHLLALNPSNATLVEEVNSYFGHSPGNLAARIPVSLKEICLVLPDLVVERRSAEAQLT